MDQYDDRFQKLELLHQQPSAPLPHKRPRKRPIDRQVTRFYSDTDPTHLKVLWTHPHIPVTAKK